MKTSELTPLAAGGIARIMNPVSRFGPRIMLAPNADGTPTADELAAKAAADEAERAAAERAAAEAERLAAEEAARIEREKNMSEAEKEKEKLLREVMDKKNKLKAEQDARKALEDRLKLYDGIDVEKVKKLIEAEKSREIEDAEKKGEFERVKKLMADQAAEEKKALEDALKERDVVMATKDSMIDALTVGADFAGSKFISEELTLTPAKARVIYGSHFEVVDGKTVAYDKPKGQANRTMLVDSAGEPLKFDDAFKKIVNADPDKDTMLKSKMKPGGHSNNHRPGTQVPNPNQPQQPQLHGMSRIRASLSDA